MGYLARNKSLVSILILFAIFTAGSKAFGVGTAIESMEVMNTMDGMGGGPGMPYNQRSKTAGIRAQRAQTANRQKGRADVAAVITELYAEMAETLNTHRRPTKEQIKSNLAALRIPRTALASLDKNMLAKFYILTAWTQYFSGDLKTAQKAALRALKTSSEIKDARITHTSITLLAGEKAVLAPKKKSTAKTVNTYQNYNTSSQGTNLLDLDIESVNTDLTNPKSPQKISAMQLNCLNSTTFTYTPGSESLCVMFWQLSDKGVASDAPTTSTTSASYATSSEPNDPSATPVTAPTTMPQNFQPQFFNEFEGPSAMQPNMNSYRNKAVKKQDPTFLSNTQAFKDIFSASFGIENVKFLAVNTDSLAGKQKVIDKIMENPWPWAHIIAHDPKSGDTQFQDIFVKHEKPLLMITSNDGTIKYAGPATGLLAPLMLSKVTGEDFNPTATANTATNGNVSVGAKVMDIFTRPQKGNNNTAAANTTIKRKQVPVQPKEMSPSDEYAASKLLENARGFIKISRKITTPKNGIEMCRKIMKDYPNTKYSEEARMLLRQVPPRYHKRYGITNEELGL